MNGGAAAYLFPRTASRLHCASSPQVEQDFPSGPISINFPFCTSIQIMDRTAEGWAFIARLISERLSPFSLLSNRLTSWESIPLPKSQQSAALIDQEGHDPGHEGLVDGGSDCPGPAELVLDGSQRCHTWDVQQHKY